MTYSNSDIKRQDRLLDEHSAGNLLKTGEYGVLSMNCKESGAYGVPINYVWDGDKSIYFHCALKGRKLQCIDINKTVSFCVVGRTNVIPEKFTTEYESIVLECQAYRLLPEKERMNALDLILDKYSPKDKPAGLNYVEKSINKTEVVRLDIIKWSGKCKDLRQ